jgi:hypothetical protein
VPRKAEVSDDNPLSAIQFKAGRDCHGQLPPTHSVLVLERVRVTVSNKEGPVEPWCDEDDEDRPGMAIADIDPIYHRDDSGHPKNESQGDAKTRQSRRVFVDEQISVGRFYAPHGTVAFLSGMERSGKAAKDSNCFYMNNTQVTPPNK